MYFQIAVKFNIAQAKKEAATKAKEEQTKQLKKEEKTLTKLADTLRGSRANVAAIAKSVAAGDEEALNIPDDHFMQGPKGRDRRAKRATQSKKTQVNDVVDDILNNSEAFKTAQPRTDMRADNGVIKQVVKGLRSSHTFSRLRGQREAKKVREEEEEDEQDEQTTSLSSSSSSSSSSAAPEKTKTSRFAKMEGTFSRNRKKKLGQSGPMDSDVRSQLKHQKSTLSRADAKAFKSSSSKSGGWTISKKKDKEVDSSSSSSSSSSKNDDKLSDQAGSRRSVMGIVWG